MRSRAFSTSVWAQVAAVTVFAVAMAYLESAVVVYLRTIFHISGELVRVTPGPRAIWFSLRYFTLLKPSALASVMPSAKIASVEVGREVATIVMLACVGWIAGRSWKTRLAYVLLAFGIWDIGYYVFLRLLVGWPTSPMTLDVLFLIPGPWVSPVFVPVLASALMILLGLGLIRSAARS